MLAAQLGEFVVSDLGSADVERDERGQGAEQEPDRRRVDVLAAAEIEGREREGPPSRMPLARSRSPASPSRSSSLSLKLLRR